MDDILLSLSYFIHLGATVVWIGGMIIFVVYIWPTVHRYLADDTKRDFLLSLQQRFRPIANLSLVLLLGTGMLQTGANENYDGLLTFENTWTIAMLFKHIAYGGMVAVAGLVQFGVVPALQRATLLASRGNTDELDILLQRERRLFYASLGLGIVVLFFTAIATAA
jgi:uncharacterized membrane protein